MDTNNNVILIIVQDYFQSRYSKATFYEYYFNTLFGLIMVYIILFI